jgi:hypothetical protein
MFPPRSSSASRSSRYFSNSTAQRSSPVGWIVSLIDQKLECDRIQANFDIFDAHPLDDFCHLEIHNLDQVVSLELVEDDGIQSVQEFRFKHPF